MYPSAFIYHRPESVAGATALLSGLGEGARLLAGGQTLIVLLKLRYDEPTDLIDIGRIPGLDTIDDSGKTVSVGALATHRRCAGAKSRHDRRLACPRRPKLRLAHPAAHARRQSTV